MGRCTVIGNLMYSLLQFDMSERRSHFLWAYLYSIFVPIFSTVFVSSPDTPTLHRVYLSRSPDWFNNNAFCKNKKHFCFSGKIKLWFEHKFLWWKPASFPRFQRFLIVCVFIKIHKYSFYSFILRPSSHKNLFLCECESMLPSLLEKADIREASNESVPITVSPLTSSSSGGSTSSFNSSFERLRAGPSSSSMSIMNFASPIMPIPSSYQYPLAPHQSAFQPVLTSTAPFGINTFKTEIPASTMAPSNPAIFQFPLNPLLFSMNKQLSDYQTSFHQLLLQQQQQQQRKLQYPPIPKTEVVSPPLVQPMPVPISPFTSIQSSIFQSTVIEKPKPTFAEKSLKLRRQSFPKDCCPLYEPELDGDLPASDAVITEKSRMLIVSAATLTKLYGSRHCRTSAANSPVVEGNIRKGDIKCVVCQDKQATGRHYGVISWVSFYQKWKKNNYCSGIALYKMNP